VSKTTVVALATTTINKARNKESNVRAMLKKLVSQPLDIHSVGTQGSHSTSLVNRQLEAATQ